MGIMDHNEPYRNEYLQDILKSAKTIAMVGASPVSYTHLTLPTILLV